MRRLLPILLVPVLCWASAATRSDGLTERDIYTVLQDRAIPFDSAVIQKGAVDGMLKAIDPRARVLPSGEKIASTKKPTLDKAEEWSEGLCYLKLNGLYDDAGIVVTNQLQSWMTAERTGLIVDLRGAGGDNLKAIDEIAVLFMGADKELFLVRDGRGRVTETHRTRPDAPAPRGLPVMLAVDSDTKDASEILAAVLKGRSRVMLIGGGTRGDAALREVVPVSKTESLYIATRWVEFPGGGSLTNGVQPDVTITQYARTPVPEKAPFGKEFSEKSKRDKELMERVVGDAVLGSATDLLLGLKALGVHATATNTPGALEK